MLENIGFWAERDRVWLVAEIRHCENAKTAR